MDAADRLIRLYTSSVKADFVALIALILGLVALVILSKGLLRHFENTGGGKIGSKAVLFVAVGALLVGIGYYSYQEVLYARDKSAVENREFETVRGKVIEHTGATDSNKPSLYDYTGVVIELENGETMRLKQRSGQLRTQLGKTYEFIYLEHSRLSVAK